MKKKKGRGEEEEEEGKAWRAKEEKIMKEIEKQRKRG